MTSRVIGRDRALVCGGLLALAAAAWLYLWHLSRAMPGPGLAAMPGMGPALAPWTAAGLGFAMMWGVIVLIEKVAPRGDLIGRVASGALIGAGLVLLGQAVRP